MNVVLCLCKTKPFEIDKICKSIAAVKEKLNTFIYIYSFNSEKMHLYSRQKKQYKKFEKKHETFGFEIEKFLAKS